LRITRGRRKTNGAIVGETGSELSVSTLMDKVSTLDEIAGYKVCSYISGQNGREGNVKYWKKNLILGGKEVKSIKQNHAGRATKILAKDKGHASDEREEPGWHPAAKKRIPQL